MALTRASCQSTRTLREFYGELAESGEGVTSSIGKQMLELLPMLEELCATRATWGLTSHAHLWLLPSDDWRSPWLVCVTAHPGRGFHIRYRLPEDDAPWPDAIVEGEAKDVAHACQLIAIAMDRSQGWKGP